MDRTESFWLNEKLTRRFLRRGLRRVFDEVDQYGPLDHMPYPVYICQVQDLVNPFGFIEDPFWVLVKQNGVYRINNRYDWLDYRKEDCIPCLDTQNAPI
jgi:hypothetical protein